LGLDVYVGPLTRYYTGDWKLITQQAAEAEGVEFHVIRQNERPPDAITDQGQVLSAVTAWRDALVAAAGGDLPRLDWDDSPTREYFTDKPDWDGYWALRLLAARDEFADERAPTRIELPSRKSDPITPASIDVARLVVRFI